MGTWSTECFGNDTAADWVWKLGDADDLSIIQKTLQRVMDTGEEYLASTESEEAIAAAETLARLLDRPGTSNSYTDVIDDWIFTHQEKPTRELVDLATKSLERILNGPSELPGLWKETDQFDEWKKNINEIRSRLVG